VIGLLMIYAAFLAYSIAAGWWNSMSAESMSKAEYADAQLHHQFFYDESMQHLTAPVSAEVTFRTFRELAKTDHAYARRLTVIYFPNVASQDGPALLRDTTLLADLEDNIGTFRLADGQVGRLLEQWKALRDERHQLDIRVRQAFGLSPYVGSY
jgi:hypothetical protein